MIVRLQDVVNRINGNVDRFNTNIKYYIGKGHGECGEIAITEHGDLEADVNTLGFKFHFAFQPGDTLFFSRSFALRKAGMAMFEGLCSDSTYILRTKNENILLGEYLPAILQSDVFWQFCDTHHTGGVNFLINWSTLAAYEFDLPPIEEQRVLAEKLWAAYRLKEAYRRLLAATQEMVKSQFIEMFGDPVSNPKGWPTATLKDAGNLLSDGPFGSHLKSSHYQETGVRVIRLQNICQGYFDDTDKAYVSEEHADFLKKYQCKPGDIVIGTLGEPNLRACLVPDYISVSIHKADCVHYLPKEEMLDKNFVCHYLNSELTLQMATTDIHGTTRARIAAGQLAKMKIYLPPLDLQREFVAIASQSDKSGFELRKAIEAIDGVIKSLINNKTEA